MGLLQLTFLRPGKMLKNDAREGENPQKSGSFLSMGSVLPLVPMLRFHVVGFWVPNSKLMQVGSRWKRLTCSRGVFSTYLPVEAQTKHQVSRLLLKKLDWVLIELRHRPASNPLQLRIRRLFFNNVKCDDAQSCMRRHRGFWSPRSVLRAAFPPHRFESYGRLRIGGCHPADASPQLARPAGLEPATDGLEVRCSIH